MKNKYSLLWALVITMCCCSEKDAEPELTGLEIAFNEKLASISKDEIIPNLYHIGSEDGVVFRYNSGNNNIDTIQTEYDRIYKVYHADKGNTYWIGTRNQGLVRCALVGDSLFQEEFVYTIPAKNKARKYSAYDIYKQNDKLYVATSHGLFVVKDYEDSAMCLLYPHIDMQHQDTLRPVVINKICKYDDTTLFCASDSGLLRVNTVMEKVQQLQPKQVKSLEIVNNELRILAEGFLYITNDKGDVVDKHQLEHAANVYYYDYAEGVNYLIGDRNIQLIKDQDLSIPSRYLNIGLKHKVRAVTCRNVIVNDNDHHQSLMVSEHSLVRIGHHQNAFNRAGIIDFACVDGTNVYFLIGSKLFCHKTTDNNTILTATHLCNIDSKGKGVSFMEVQNGYLYYVSADKKQIFKKELKSNFFLNMFSSEIPLNNMLGKEITAIGKDCQNVYVGVRDGFQNVNQEKKLQLYYNSHNRDSSNICPDPFITAMTDTLKQGAKGDIFLGTLNDGLFEGKDNDFYRYGDSEDRFIRDVAVDDNGIMYVLTNRKLSVYGALKDSVIIKDAQGYNRLLIGAHPYGLKEYGIHDFETDLDFFTDVQFNPHACVALNGIIYAGSNNGVYVFKELRSENGKGCGNKTVFFEPEYEPLSLRNIILFCLLLLTILIISILWYRHYHKTMKMWRKVPALLKDSKKSAQKEERRASVERVKLRLRSRMNELEKFADFYDENMMNRIRDLSLTIDNLGGDELDNVQEKANVLNKEIQQITFQIPTMLNLALEKQMQEIKTLGESSEWLKETDDARTNSDVTYKASIIRNNEELIEQAKETAVKLDELKYQLSDLILIPEVTEECKKIINSNCTSKEKVCLLEKQVESIDTVEARTKIKDYMFQKIDEIDQVMEGINESSICRLMLNKTQDEYQTMVEYCNNMKVASMQVLQDLAICDNHLKIIQSLLSIRNSMEEYKYASENGFSKEKKLTVKNVLVNEIDVFYRITWNSKDRWLLSLLNIKAKKGGTGQFLDANVLALLLAEPSLKNKDIKLVFVENNEQRIRSSRRELIKKIDSRRQEISRYAETTPASIADLLLEIAD